MNVNPKCVIYLYFGFRARPPHQPACASPRYNRNISPKKICHGCIAISPVAIAVKSHTTTLRAKQFSDQVVRSTPTFTKQQSSKIINSSLVEGASPIVESMLFPFANLILRFTFFTAFYEFRFACADYVLVCAPRILNVSSHNN